MTIVAQMITPINPAILEKADGCFRMMPLVARRWMVE
jgi:hypothetical protein